MQKIIFFFNCKLSYLCTASTHCSCSNELASIMHYLVSFRFRFQKHNKNAQKPHSDVTDVAFIAAAKKGCFTNFWGETFTVSTHSSMALPQLTFTDLTAMCQQQIQLRFISTARLFVVSKQAIQPVNIREIVLWQQVHEKQGVFQPPLPPAVFDLTRCSRLQPSFSLSIHTGVIKSKMKLNSDGRQAHLHVSEIPSDLPAGKQWRIAASQFRCRSRAKTPPAMSPVRLI